MQLGIMDIENSKNSSIGGRVTKNLFQANPGCDGPSYSVLPPPPGANFDHGVRSSVFSMSLVITYENICRDN